MSTKDLKVALKIETDSKQAEREVALLKSGVDSLGYSSKKLGSDITGASDALDKIASDLQQANQQSQAAGQTFIFAGRSAFSLRDSFNGVAQASTGLDSSITSTDAAVQKIESDLQRAQQQLQAAGQMFVYAGQSSFSLRDGFVASSNQAKVSSETISRLLNTYDAQAVAATKLAEDERLLKAAYQQGKLTAEQYTRAMQNLNSTNQQVGKGFGSVRGMAQNFGWQLQDIAVQAQAGVSPAVILSQQGSQLVSSFNPLAGAVIAVAGALGGALLPSLFNNASATEKLNEKIRELNEEFKGLTESQKGSLIDEEVKHQKQLKESVSQTEKEIKKLESSYAAWQKLLANPDAIGKATASVMGGGRQSDAEITKGLASVEALLTTARAKLDTTNQELAKSESEIQKIRTGHDPEADAKAADKLIDQLRQQIKVFDLQGAALGNVVADELHADETRRKTIVTLHEQMQAQKDKKKADDEAAAEEKSRERQAETTFKNNEKYVRSLELQADALTQTTQATANAEFAERGLIGAQLERARAARQTIDADKERLVLAELQLKLSQAQSKGKMPSFEDFRAQYKKLLDQLGEDSKAQGEQIVKNLFDIATLDAQLSEAEKDINRTLSDISRQETSINTQREAGLLSEYEARQKIYELHQAQAQKLEAMRPMLEELSKQPGQVGEDGKAALQALDAEILRLQSTMTLLQSTLRDGLEQGFTDAIKGLADGTMSLRDAITAVANSVAQALEQMAAQALAQQAANALLGGDKKDSGESMKQAAVAMDSSALIWTGVAARIQAAAQSLAAASATSSLGGSSGGEGSNYAGYVQAFASVFASTGGHVTGPGSGTSDSINAWVSNNEFITRAAVVTQPGALDFLHDFNRHGMSALSAWAPVFHNTGGLAGYPAPAMPSPSIPAAAFDKSFDQGPAGAGGVTNRILNVVDPQLIEDHFYSARGDQLFVNLIKRNTAVVQRVAGTK